MCPIFKIYFTATILYPEPENGINIIDMLKNINFFVIIKKAKVQWLIVFVH